jgi:hypothetical protein
MTGLSGVPNKATFVATKLHGSLSPLTLDDVEGWLRAHGDTLVIADLKESPMEALAKIRWVTRVPGRWLPEVRSGLEIQLAKTLGLGGPILMTDLQTPSQDDVKTLVQKHNLRWVGFPLARFVVSPIVPWLHEQGALVLVHPVDDPLSRWAVQSRQGDAIYTTVAPSNAPCAIPSADAWAASLTRQAPSPNP